MKKIKSVTIIVTNNCNLNCSYCYEKNKRNMTMPFKTLKGIIDKELCLKENDNYVLHFSFFGGEPFLEHETIRAAIEYFKTSYPQKSNVYFFATTNGTCISPDTKKWLKENKSIIRCGLSVDGTPEMHNKNRSNSFDLIDIDFFVKTWPEQSVKMTISPETIDNMAEGVIYLHERGLNVNCNLAYGVNWRSSNYVHVLSDNLMRLIKYYLEHNRIEPCSMLNISLDKIQENKDTSISYKQCGTKTSIKAYDCDGTAYPCQYFIPATMVNYEQSGIELLGERFNRNLLPRKCRKCVLYNVCSNCYGANYMERGNLFMNSEVNCDVSKLTASATAYLQFEKYKKGDKHFDNKDDEYRFLRGIKFIQDSV